MSQGSTTGGEVARRAVESRLPVLPEERVFTTASSFLWTCVTLGATGAGLLVGKALPHAGIGSAAILAFVAGLLVALVPAVLAGGIPSARLGVDTIEVSKSSFGVRGVALPLGGLILLCLGWTFVLAPMTATILADMGGAAPDGQARAGIGLAILAVVWLFASRGPELFERLAVYLGPALTILSFAFVVLLIGRFGMTAVAAAKLPAEALLTTDPRRGFLIAFEWGAATGLVGWPLLGGVARLVRDERHVVTPAIFAWGVVNPLSIILCAALAEVLVADGSPLGWMPIVGGALFGGVGIVLVVVANVNLMVILLYTAGVAVQHLPAVARARWEGILAALIAPGIYLSFFPDWVLDNVTTVVTYSGVMFAGITAVTFTDYYFLRRQEVETLDLFRTDRAGRYYFWRGVNLCAIGAVTVGIALDLWLLDPVTLEAAGPFLWAGATIPTLIVSGALHYAGTRLLSIPAGRGSYPS